MMGIWFRDHGGLHRSLLWSALFEGLRPLVLKTMDASGYDRGGKSSSGDTHRSRFTKDLHVARQRLLVCPEGNTRVPETPKAPFRHVPFVRRCCLPNADNSYCIDRYKAIE